MVFSCDGSAHMGDGMNFNRDTGLLAAQLRQSYDMPRHRVFISFFGKPNVGNQPEVDAFIDRWADQENVFEDYVLGARRDAYGKIEQDALINSRNTDYVMSRIRQDYIKQATVTLVLVGNCTHSRRYVDWEIKSSLTQPANGKPNGLLAIALPSTGGQAILPERFKMNWSRDQAGTETGYAQFMVYPNSANTLAQWIHAAFERRERYHHYNIMNTQDKMRDSSKCKICCVTH